MDADKQCGSYSKAVHFLKDTFTPPPCPLPLAPSPLRRSPHGEERARTSLALFSPFSPAAAGEKGARGMRGR